MLSRCFIEVVLFVVGTCYGLQNRMSCEDDSNLLLSRLNSTHVLEELRLQFTAANIDALIVTSDDEHQNEFVGPSDKRIKFISGFTGSAGTVVVTKTKAALWTDGRYHIQADKELDCNWILMRSGLPKVPKVEEWLISEFPTGSKIGSDAKLVPATTWISIEKALHSQNTSSYELVPTEKNLIDAVWKNKPPTDEKQAYVLDLTYSGKKWQQKINETRHAIGALGAEAIIVTALDEIAWLLNLRGNDIPYTPVVASYLFLSKTDIILFLEENKRPSNFSEVYELNGEEQVIFKDYNSIWTELPTYLQPFKKILVPSALSYNPGVSKAIYDLVPDDKRIFQPSPVIHLKAEKNPTEIKWMEHAHVQDAVALCEFFERLEQSLNTMEMDELKAANLLDDIRLNSSSTVMLSFKTISGYGPHGAQPHYIPTPDTTIKIVNGSLLVIDSGGNYLGGTTDVTRTISIGKPTSEQKEAYTRVLMGAIDLSSFVFPDVLNISQVDLLARAHLWEIGYDYLHGTGHGVGSFLLVHEAPINIMYKSHTGTKFKPGHFTSIEPGFYLEGKFGIRLENVVGVIEKTDLKYKTEGTYLSFKTVTLFPYDINLIDFNLLSNKQMFWLKEYYKQILIEVGGELKRQDKITTYNWLVNQLSYLLDQ